MADNDQFDPQHTHGQVLDHEYDGIKEFDNPTPGWWHLLFIASIIFSVLYIAFFGGDLGWSIYGELERTRTNFYEAVYGELGVLEPDEATVVELLGQDARLALGASIFQQNCAVCHVADGGGNIGSNLTDDHYMNVKEIGDFYNVVTEGVISNGMPSWSVQLNQTQRVLVSAYAASLRGTTPATPKAPQGEPIDPWPAPASAATNAGE